MAELALLLTRIFDFMVSPTRPVVGGEVTISGTLKWKQLWYWVILGGEAVNFIVDGEVVATQTTKSGLGTFRFTWSPPRTGIYWVKVRYGGSLIYNPCESEDVRVEAITEEEKKEEDTRLLLMAGGAIGAVAIAGIGLALYSEESKRREMMLLARR